MSRPTFVRFELAFDRVSKRVNHARFNNRAMLFGSMGWVYYAPHRKAGYPLRRLLILNSRLHKENV